MEGGRKADYHKRKSGEKERERGRPSPILFPFELVFFYYAATFLSLQRTMKSAETDICHLVKVLFGKLKLKPPMLHMSDVASCVQTVSVGLGAA